MISFHLDGRQVYANVFEQRHSPAVYKIHFIDHIVPADIKLHEKNGKIVADAAYDLDPELVKAVIKEIVNNPNRI